ncbi:MAG TPA: hypothetical protein P5294_09105 [Smithellaceae bacterium]|nr:hypothetical protein [Smithellaceae bacterium]HRS89915.1 hypothetical protein [Smithellaceae bacterium]HRV26686.1 hypothetical protein [Smithellaceae bacterium]
MNDFANIFLELLEKLETDIANLYKLFAEKFPAHRYFWEELSKEEVQHAVYIKKLSAYSRQKIVYLDENKIKTLTIKFITDGIESTYKKTKANELNIINALAYSLNLEDSIIENKFYEYFSTNDQNIAFLLSQIKRETIEHAKKVKQALRDAKAVL